MGLLQKVGSWFSDRSDRFIRGAGRENGYYTTREAREAYRGAGNEPDVEDAEDQANQKPETDPFGHGEGDYGGRVPYRSKRDQEAEAYREQQRAAQQTPPMAQQQPMQAQQPMMGQQPPMGQQPQQPMGQQPVQQPYGASGNVVPFPGMRQGPDGMVYAHVEYIVLLRNRNECKNVIGYIKTNASVFLNMEFIASDSERQRCVDMLSGAAYTLGCALNKISPRGIYLISAPSVKVVVDPGIQKFASAPESQGYARQRYDNPFGSQSQAPAYEQPNSQATGSFAAQGTGSFAAQRQETPAFEPRMSRSRSGFAAESPTARFMAQGTQRSQPANIAAVMGGGQDAGGQFAYEYTQ